MAAGQQIASLYAEIGIDISKLDRGLKSSDSMLKSFGNTMTNVFKIGVGVAVAGVAALAAGLGSALTASAKFDRTMSGAKAILGATGDEMTKLNALAMQLGKDTVFSASEAGKAIEMLGQDGLNVQEIMGGAAKATVDLAAATGTDLSNAANIGSKAMKAFGIPADKMQQAINGIAGAANTNGLTIDGYAQAIAMAGGVAGSVGVSFDDFNATIAAIAPSFSSGSDAGTGFKTFLTRLVPQSDEAADAMKKIGLFTGMTGDEMDKTKAQMAKYEAQLAGLDPSSKNYERRADELKTKINSLNGSLKTGQNAFFNADGSMKNMADVAGVLQKSLAGLSDEAKVDALNTIFGTDASRVASALAKAGAAGFQSVFDKIAKTDAAQQAATRMDNLAGDVEQLSGSFDTLKIAIGHAFDPLARKVVQYITGGLNKLLGMDFKPFAARFDFAWEKIQKVIERVIGTFNRFASKTSGGLPSILAGLGEVFGEWAGDIWAWIEPGLSAAITNLANWIRSPSGNSGLASALSNGWSWFKDWAGDVWGWVQPKLGELWSALSSWITDDQKRGQLWQAIVNGWNWFIQWADYIWEGGDGKGGVKWALGAFWNYLSSWITDEQKRNQLVSAIVTGWNWFADWASYIWTGSDGKGGVKSALGAFWSYLASWVTDEQKRSQVWSAITTGWNWFAEWAGYIWEGSDGKGGVKFALTSLWGYLSSWVTDDQKRGQLWQSIVDGWNWFADWADYIWEGSDGKGGVKFALGTFWDWLTGWVTDDQKRSKLVQSLSDTWSWFTGWADYIWEGSDGKGGVKSALGEFWGWLSSWVTDSSKRTQLLADIGSAWTSFSEWAGSIWTGTDGKSGVSAQLLGLWSNINAWLLKNVPALGPWENAFSSFIKGAKEQWLAAFPEMQAKFGVFKTSVSSNITELGKSFDGLWKSIFGDTSNVDLSSSGGAFVKMLDFFVTKITDKVVNVLTILRLSMDALAAGIEAWKALLNSDWGTNIEQGKIFTNKLFEINSVLTVGAPGTSTNPATPDNGGIIGHKASGGMVRGGNSYIVGERGPELFSPSSNGYIHNADNTSALLGGKTMTINLNVTGESNLPMDRAKLRELTKMLANEMNLSGARLIMQN